MTATTISPDTIEAEPAREFFLGPAVPGKVVAEGDGLLDRVQVLALEVLDHRQLGDPLVVEVEDPGGDLVELGLDAGTEPALAGDELVAVVDLADDDRLEHPVLAMVGWCVLLLAACVPLALRHFNHAVAG